MRGLVIGGLEIPMSAAHKLEQNYEPVQAVSRIRMMDSQLNQQVAWSGKLRTSILSAGIMPAGLQALDYSQQIIVKCVAERVISSVGNVIVVPSQRRSDYGVEGRALVSGAWQSVAVSLSSDTATLAVASGATLYQAIYWPELICFCDPPSEDRGVRTADYSWRIEAEQI